MFFAKEINIVTFAQAIIYMRTLFVVILLIINGFVVEAQYNNNSNFKGYVGISIPELLNVGVIKIIEDNYHVGGGLGGAYIFGVLWKTINVEQRFYYGKIQKGSPHKSFFIKHHDLYEPIW